LVSVHQGVRWTWPELAQRADRLAAGLSALGLAPGDRLGIWSPNCVEWTLTQFAAARLGLILTNLNPAYRAVEVETR
jgi:fatty-acyl-CoA synthase